MPSPLDLMLDNGQYIGQLGQAIHDEQPVSGARANILQYMQKVLNGEMDVETARVLAQHGHTVAAPVTPRQDQALPVQPQATPASGLGGGTADDFIASYLRPQPFKFQVPTQPGPVAPSPAAPAPTAGLAAPVPAGAPAPAPAAAPPAPVEAPLPANGGLADAKPTTAYPIPANARDARAALGFGTPVASVQQGVFDPSGYDSAIAQLQAKTAPRQMPKFDVGVVKNKDYDAMHGMLSEIIKTRNSDKQAAKALELQVALERDKLRANDRMARSNLDHVNKARLSAMKMEQAGDFEAARLMQKYASLMETVRSREFVARLNSDPAYLDSMIRLIGQLESAEAQVIGSGMGRTAEGREDITDLANTKSLLMPMLKTLIEQAQAGRGQVGRGGAGVEVKAGSGTKKTPVAGQATPPPAPVAPPPLNPTPATPAAPAAPAAPKPAAPAAKSSAPKPKPQQQAKAAPEQKPGKKQRAASLSDALDQL